MSKGLEALEEIKTCKLIDHVKVKEGLFSNKLLDYERRYGKDVFSKQIPIIEKELKEYEQLKIIEQAQTRGFYFKDYQNNNEIRFSGNTFIRVRNQFVQTKPCYEVKETTLYSCYNPLDYPSPSKKVEDAHFWSWKTHLHFGIDDYGKTWALTREELEK